MLTLTLRYDSRLRGYNVFRVIQCDQPLVRFEAVLRLNETMPGELVVFDAGMFGREVPPKPRPVSITRLGEGEFRSEPFIPSKNIPMISLFLTGVPNDERWLRQLCGG